jgi:hypothetical protein
MKVDLFGLHNVKEELKMAMTRPSRCFENGEWVLMKRI